MKTHPSKPAALLLLAAFSGGASHLGTPLDALLCGSANGQTVTMVPGITSLRGISDDGRTVSGGNLIEGVADYYLWNVESGFVQSHASNPSQFSVTPLSGDGHVFAGADPVAFLYRDDGTRTDIPLGSSVLRSSAVFGLSHDGSVAAGFSLDANSNHYAWSWTPSGGTQFLPFSAAVGVSGDGHTIIGNDGSSLGVVWRDGSLTHLQAPLGAQNPFTSLWATNFSGDIIVGRGNGRPVVWMNGEGTYLPMLTGTSFGVARAVNGDGTVVICNTTAGDFDGVPYIWSPSRGSESLASYFASFGVSLPVGYTPYTAVVTPDGRTFGITTGGSDNFTYGFIVTVPSPASTTLSLVVLAASHRRRQARTKVVALKST